MFRWRLMMKRLMIVLLVTVLSFIAFGNAQADLNDGLVAYYPFNGNANDESGNGNDGVVNGATLTEDRHGQFNSAYDFQNGYIDVPNANPLASVGTGPFSVSLWGKMEASTFGVFFLVGDNDSESFEIYHNECPGPCNIRATMVGYGPSCGVLPITLLQPWETGKWYHITVVVSEQQMRFYVDGI